MCFPRRYRIPWICHNLIDCVMCVGVWWVPHRIFTGLIWDLLTTARSLNCDWSFWGIAQMWLALFLVCGCVMSPTSGVYWVDLGFINNYKKSKLWLVLLRYSVNVASTFPWVVTLWNNSSIPKAIVEGNHAHIWAIECQPK